jgi:creatinine amidohydrolase
MTFVDIAEAAKRDPLVVLPLGCTEQHAPHLPVDTDSYQVGRLVWDGARKAAELYGTEVLVLPTLPFGPTDEHDGYPGTINLGTETYVRIIKDVLASVVDSGFRRALVVRGCGGHWVVPGVVWEAKADARRAGHDVVFHVLVSNDGWREAADRHFPGADNGHAAVMETALCMAGRPELVVTERMKAPELRDLWRRYLEGGEAFLFDEVSDTGALGSPLGATAEGGQKVWEDVAAAFAERLHLLEELDGCSR